MNDTSKTKEQLINELTELRKQVAALHLIDSTQMEFSENLLQHSAVPTFVLDSQHHVIIWNRACEELTGIKQADVVGTDEPWKAFYNYKRPVLADIVLTGNIDDLEKNYDLYMPSPLIPEGLQAEGWHPDLNGRDRYIFFDAVPIRNAAGMIIAAIETVQDITERKEAEESLRILSQAIEQAPMAVVITDHAGSIEYVNPCFTKVTGYSAAEAIGQNPRIIKSGLHPQEFYAGLWATILAGKEWHGEFRNKKKNGELYWEESSISPVKNAAGEITHFVGVKEDVSERKWAEEQLQQAKAVAEAATRAKSEFLANMSHEIRTPMNATTGMLYLLQQTPLTEKQKNYLDKARGATNSLLRIINDILDFSKIEAGKLEMEFIPFHLSTVLNHLTDLASAASQSNF